MFLMLLFFRGSFGLKQSGKQVFEYSRVNVQRFKVFLLAHAVDIQEGRIDNNEESL